MDVTKPYKFIGFGAIHSPNTYKFIGLGAIHGPKTYKFIGFGAIHGPIPFKLIVPIDRRAEVGDHIGHLEGVRVNSMLHSGASGPEIGLPGRILAGLLPGKHLNRPSSPPKAGRRADFHVTR